MSLILRIITVSCLVHLTTQCIAGFHWPFPYPAPYLNPQHPPGTIIAPGYSYTYPPHYPTPSTTPATSTTTLDPTTDFDGDGVLNGDDNCPQVANADQSDLDFDAIGDACDEDTDGDGKDDGDDNCPFVKNVNQTSTNAQGVGDACVNDVDGDGTPDNNDPCPLNKNIKSSVFSGYEIVNYIGSSHFDSILPHTEESPEWTVKDNGGNITQLQSSVPSYLIGPAVIGSFEMSGKLCTSSTADGFEAVSGALSSNKCTGESSGIGGVIGIPIDIDVIPADNDIVGFVFSRQRKNLFYLIKWKRETETHNTGVIARLGVSLHLFNAPDDIVIPVEAHWRSDTHPGYTTKIWENSVPWENEKAYSWKITHNIESGEIRFVVDGLLDSGNISESTLKGGKLGFYSNSLNRNYWTGVSYKCL